MSPPDDALTVHDRSAASGARLDLHVALLWGVAGGGFLWGLLILAVERLT